MWRAGFAVVVCLGLMRTAVAQDAQVTFYSNGSLANEMLPATDHGLFQGWLYRDQERLGEISYHMFVTLRMAPGGYVFSASFSGKHPAQNSQLALTLEANHSYFMRIETEKPAKTLLIPGGPLRKGRLDPVTCQVAHQEAETMTPLEAKHLSAAARASLVQTASFPACQ
jgi:hypothetical protein